MATGAAAGDRAHAGSSLKVPAVERARTWLADRDDDLIADHEPLLGLLDDVLLIELAWPAFADEAEDYCDFCAYRSVEHPPGSPADQRAAWVRDRLAEIALWRHVLRVNDSHYAHLGHPEILFRVG